MDQNPKITRSAEKAEMLLAGDITASTSTELRAALKNLVGDGVRELVVDLSNVRVVDSSGIGLLVAAHNSLSRLGGQVSVINASNDLIELFKAFRLDKHFSIARKE